MRTHTHRTLALGLTALLSTLAPVSVVRADDVGVSVRIGDADGPRLGIGHYDHDDDDRRSWDERIDRNFDRLRGDRGDIRRAYRRFQALTSERPHAPLPRIGQGIASLLLGDDYEALRHFRRVAADAPAALARSPIDHRLHDRLHWLKERLTREAEWGGHGSDWFIIASLHVLTGHEQQARRAVRLAIECGERSVGAQQLADYLGVRRERHRPEAGRGPDDDRRRRGRAPERRGWRL